MLEKYLLSNTLKTIMTYLHFLGELYYQKIHSDYIAEHGSVYISSKIEVTLNEDVFSPSTKKGRFTLILIPSCLLFSSFC